MASSSLPLSLVPVSPPSPSLTPVLKDGENINWSELPSELTTSIMQRLGVIEILENAQKVCMSWRRVSKDPAVWRKIVMHKVEDLGYGLEIMCRHAVDRSQGGLVETEIWDFGTDSLINYIADSSRNLRRLKLVKCYQISKKGLSEALAKLPFLEELELSYCSAFSGESLKFIGHSFPNLKTLKLNSRGLVFPQIESNDVALAIAETMHGLRNLQLFGNMLSDTGLNAILDNCPNLERLDLRQCFNVNIVGDLEKRCSERIKVLRHPNDSTHDYPYDATVMDMRDLIPPDGYLPGMDDLDFDSDFEY